jgi:hypothetical protein
MSIQDELQEARQKVIRLLEKGHIAKVEETYTNDQLTGVTIHHYALCRQCVIDKEKASGKGKV